MASSWHFLVALLVCCAFVVAKLVAAPLYRVVRSGVRRWCLATGSDDPAVDVEMGIRVQDAVVASGVHTSHWLVDAWSHVRFSGKSLKSSFASMSLATSHYKTMEHGNKPTKEIVCASATEILDVTEEGDANWIRANRQAAPQNHAASHRKVSEKAMSVGTAEFEGNERERAGHGGRFSCGPPAATNLRFFVDRSGVCKALDKRCFNVLKGAITGSPGVKVKRAYFGAPGSTKEERELMAIKILSPKVVVEHRERNADDYKAFERSDYTDIECPINEIGVYRRLAEEGGHPNVLKMIDVFANFSTSETWLVLELCHGDLLEYVRAMETRGERVCPPSKLRHFVRQILQAVGHIHQLGIGHRDISLENLLLSGSELTVKLMDFGQACLLRPPDAESPPYRYFRKTAKDVYRSPEQYIPPPSRCPNLQLPVYRCGAVGKVVQLCELEDIGPIAAEYQFCEVRLPDSYSSGHAAACETQHFGTDISEEPVQPKVYAQLAGYEGGPADVFAIGSVMFTLHTGTTAWKIATLDDAGFKFMCVAGIQRMLDGWNKPFDCAGASQLLSHMLMPAPARRPSVAHCLAHPWLNETSAL